MSSTTAPSTSNPASTSAWGDVADLRTLNDSPPHQLTVADLLQLDILQRGRPEVLAGTNLESRVVRWVHTSEIYEISPLLKGGEVLLTTGLGLVGVGPAALGDYVRALAERSIAALVLELGRTFARTPQPIVDVAREAGLPLITLRGIVPFVEITETVHAMLISREVARLRLARHIDTVMTSSLVAGAGLSGLLRDLATLAECPVRLYGMDGHIVAASDPLTGAPSESDIGPANALNIAGGDYVLDRAGAGIEGRNTGRGAGTDAAAITLPQASVELRSHTWGRLVVCGSPTVARALIAERGAVAIAIELGRSGSSGGGPSRRRAGAHLLRDIFGRQYSSVDDITGRAAALGLAIRPTTPAAGICLSIDTSRRAINSRTTSHPPQAATARGASTADIVADAAESILGPALVAELDGSILIAATTGAGDPRHLLDALADAIDAALPGGRAVAVVCGPSASDVTALVRSLRIARESSVLARRLHSDMRTLRYTDMGVHRLISRFATDPELAAFVDEQLGPLLDYDAARGRELVRTLDTLLACGLSKAQTARALHIRRQTLYQRLDTIERLLGGIDLTARERRTSLDLALVGWRLRTAGAAPVTAPPGSGRESQLAPQDRSGS
ncbi:MAG: PucR family transcriptional regulator [Nakamurella sp.]